MSGTRKVGMFEAKTHFSALVDEVQKGAEIEVTKRGVTVAKLVPIVDHRDRDDIARAIVELKQLRKGVTLGELKIKDLINEGRKY